MALWHLMFQKPAFKHSDIDYLTAQLNEAGTFGGLPITSCGVVRDTAELIYVDLAFELDHGLTQPVFNDMAKFPLLLAAGIEDAPLPVYYAVMQKSLADLNISYQMYPDHSLDMFYWQQSPITKAPDTGLHFK